MVFKKIALVGALLGTGLAQAFAPQTGTWIVTSEVNGKPGRGLAIDVQDNTLVMQMYAYDASGNATFYMTSGPLANDNYAAPLNKYRGGRYLGSGELSGKEDGSAGTVSMRFVSGTKGYITLPGEAEKEISRFNFAYANDPQGLKGIWLFSPLNSLTPTADFFRLEKAQPATQYGNGLMASSDGSFGCEHQVTGNAAGTVLCVKVNSAGKVLRGYQFIYSVNDGEGNLLNSLGQATSIAAMRRLANRTDTGTGIFLKSESSDAAAAPVVSPDQLRLAIESVAAQVE
ncbi:hypothetical protein M2375_004493 [Comamonas sp. BIGb0152]|uniref:hypothetical protein n=1 Tax=Comamonas sp. BIGb0152 TaxID=2940601 RepID=UPI0021674856|nr:hypothetical protein [Comamonas sp. BIGb0152]MCS4296235.1 hypothetical protein [Comamonas sp. BIGb0152]